VSSRWGEFEEKTIGNDKFPAYSIKTFDEKGDPMELVDGFKARNKNFAIFLDSDTPDVGLWVYREGQVLTPAADGTYILNPGNNQLGAYVVGDIGGGKWKYVDFKYFNVKLDQPSSTTSTSGGKPVITSFTGPEALEFDANFNNVGMYTFNVSVEGGTPPYYYIWKGNRAPQILMEGPNYNSITISPQQMRMPGAMKDGYFVWVTVRDSKNQHATWGNGSTEYLYGLKFTGKFEIVNGETKLVENTWQVVKEP
jgi:hypothetical protein